MFGSILYFLVLSFTCWYFMVLCCTYWYFMVLSCTCWQLLVFSPRLHCRDLAVETRWELWGWEGCQPGQYLSNVHFPCWRCYREEIDKNVTKSWLRCDKICVIIQTCKKKNFPQSSSWTRPECKWSKPTCYWGELFWWWWPWWPEYYDHNHHNHYHDHYNHHDHTFMIMIMMTISGVLWWEELRPQKHRAAS